MQPLRAGDLIVNLLALLSADLSGPGQSVVLTFTGGVEQTYRGQPADDLRRAFNRALPGDDANPGRMHGLVPVAALPRS